MTHSITTPESQNDQLNTSTVQSNPLDAITVYYGNVIKNSYPKPQKLSWIIEQIRNSADLKQKVSQVRSITDVKSRQDAKAALLPYFCFQKFKNNRRVNVEFDSTKFIIQDLDHLGSRLIDIRSKLILDSDVFMVFLSPSGDGLKVVFEMDQMVIGGDQYRNSFGHLRTMLEAKYGIAVDDNDDPSRACYLSSDPNIHINLNRKLHSEILNNPVTVTTVRKSKITTAINGSASPGRTDAMSSVIGVLNQRGVEEHVALNLVHAWNKHYNNPPLPDDKVGKTVKDEYERYKHQSSIQPVRIISQDNNYITVSGRNGKNVKTQITNFVIEPKELLKLQGSDCLTCSVTTNQGVKYDDIILENTDWHSRTKLLKAIGHQDCSFFGNDSDVQNLCSHVNSYVPIRKKGTKVIGLVNDTWVVDGMNITSSGNCSMSIIPYQKGTDAFYHKIVYKELDNVSYTQLLQDFYSNITLVNSQETILPILGWNFAAPLKPIIMNQLGSFPLMFIHGGQGGGKTSTIKLFMRLHGYKDDKPQMCDMKPFPMLKLLSSSNAIPVVLDEFKMKDMKQDSIDNLLRFMRKTYDGEVETKGRADQTTESYNLEAPLVVMGEWNINQPAIKERIIFPRFSGTVKKDKAMQAAFQKISSLPLEGFMPRYIEFCLGVDLKNKYEAAKRYVQKVFKEHTVAPRIVHNLSTMILGLMLFRDYGRYHRVTVPKMNYKDILKSQLKEITGNDTGMVSSAVDQLFEALAVYAQYKEKIFYNTTSPTDPLSIQPKWFKLVDIADDNKNSISCLAIQFNQVFPEFKEYAKRTNYEGDLLDAESFRKLFDESSYILKSSHPVDFKSSKYRCVCINIEKAKEADINLEGFGLESKIKAPTQTP